MTDATFNQETALAKTIDEILTWTTIGDRVGISSPFDRILLCHRSILNQLFDAFDGVDINRGTWPLTLAFKDHQRGNNEYSLYTGSLLGSRAKARLNVWLRSIGSELLPQGRVTIRFGASAYSTGLSKVTSNQWYTAGNNDGSNTKFLFSTSIMEHQQFTRMNASGQMQVKIGESESRQSVNQKGDILDLLTQCASTLPNVWTVEMGYPGTAKIIIPVSPDSLKTMFKLRDPQTASGRRAAIVNWVSEHFRVTRRNPDEEAHVREHFRGKMEFTCLGFSCKVNVSKPDRIRAFDAEQAKLMTGTVRRPRVVAD